VQEKRDQEIFVHLKL